MSEPRYLPTQEEADSNGWNYCFTADVMPLGPTIEWHMPPLTPQDTHEHHQ